MYTWLAVYERLPMAWPITVINKVTTFCVTLFEDKVFKTKKIENGLILNVGLKIKDKSHTWCGTEVPSEILGTEF